MKTDDEHFDFLSEADFFPKPKYTKVDPIPAKEKLAFEKESACTYKREDKRGRYIRL